MTDEKKPPHGAVERGVINSLKPLHGTKKLFVGIKNCRFVCHGQVAIRVLRVVGPGLFVLIQGAANAAPLPEIRPGLNASNLYRLQSVDGGVQVLAANQAIPDGVNDRIQLNTPVPINSTAASHKEADKTGNDGYSEGVKALLGKDCKYLIHACLSLFVGLGLGWLSRWMG